MLGRRSNILRGNSTTTTWYFDGISRISNLVQDLTSTSGDITFGFGYNNASQITQRTLSNDSYSYFSLPQSKAYVPDGLNLWRDDPDERRATNKMRRCRGEPMMPR
jgi:hypothetical protein